MFNVWFCLLLGGYCHALRLEIKLKSLQNVLIYNPLLVTTWTAVIFTPVLFFFFLTRCGKTNEGV